MARCLVWNVTVAVTTAALYLAYFAIEAGSAAEAASSLKETKCVDLSVNHEFVPAAFETHGRTTLVLLVTS